MIKRSFRRFYPLNEMLFKSFVYLCTRTINLTCTIFNIKYAATVRNIKHQIEDIRKIFTRTRECTDRETNWIYKQIIWHSL